YLLHRTRDARSRHAFPTLRSSDLRPRWRIWMRAARVPPLPAAITPVLVGSAAAWSQDSFLPGVLVAAMIASILIQVGTNFANDLFDYKRGADTEQRTGPTRVT